MKNMRKKITVTAVLAVLVTAISACGSTQYPQQPSMLPSAPTDTTELTGIDAFNTKWTSESTNIPLTDLEKRTMAYFLRYDTTHVADNRVVCPVVSEDGTFAGQPRLATGGWGDKACALLGILNGPWSTKPTGDCRYGYKAENFLDINGACFEIDNYLRAYFRNDSGSAIPKVYPGPKDVGNMVSDIKMRFGANIDEATRELVTGDGAYLEIKVATSHVSTTFKFDTVTSFSAVPAKFGKTDIKVTFSDDCGNITLEASMWQGTLYNPRISFFNTGASYKKASCYYGGRLPNPAVRLNNFPDVLPESIDTDPNDWSRAQLFVTHSNLLNDFQEE